MQEVREAELRVVVERTWNLKTLPLSVLALLLASSNESHLKVVKKMSKRQKLKKLFQAVTVWHGVQHCISCLLRYLYRKTSHQLRRII